MRYWWNVPGIIYDKLQDRDGRIQLGFYLSFALIFFATGGIIDRTLFSPLEITPEEQRCGWNEDLATREAPRIAALMPKFAITDGDGNIVSGAGKCGELWRFAKLANGGRHIPTWKQESGDCVSMGWSNAVAYRQGFQIAQEQRGEVLKIPFPPYMYGVSRVLIGKRQLGRSPGPVGAWAAQGSQAYGVLPVDEATQQGYRYSGRLADQWGQQGPPQTTIQYASKFRIRTVSQVRSWEDVRDAIVHGYPVTVASNIGFSGQFVDEDSKRWATARGTWGHQMCFIGAEDRAGRLKGAYCLNSWGADAHPKPLNDEPPGGFWVDWQTVQRMVAQGDSWAYSDFDGFPATDAGADWSAFKLQVADTDDAAEQVARAEQRDSPPALKEVRQMVPLEFLIPVLLAGLCLAAGLLYTRYGQRSKTVGPVLVLLAIIGITARADAGRQKRMARQQQQFSQIANPCANGRCPTGYQRPAHQPSNPAAGLPAEMQPTPRADASEVTPPSGSTPVAEFAAFGPCEPVATAASPAAEHIWTAFPETSGRSLRSYADCWHSEPEFTLVIGTEAAALQELEVADKPVAHEERLRDKSPGTYDVWTDNNQRWIASRSGRGRVNRHVGAR